MKSHFFSDKVLRKNFSYLFVLQMANYIIPLVLLPYIGTVLGANNFGKIMFVQAFVAYFLLFVDFGFNVSGTKAIVESRESKMQMSQIFWDIMFAKGIILVLAFIIFVILIGSVERFYADRVLFFVGFISVLSSFLFPLWLFQGLEKMKEVTIVNVLPKILMLFFVFAFVKTSDDYMIALLIQMLAVLLSAGLSLIIILQKKYISFAKPTFGGAIEQFKNSWHIFLTSLSTNLYTTTSTVVLGILTNDAIVGVYSAADKLIRALISFLSSIMQVIFPRVNVYYQESQNKALRFINQILKVIGVLCVLLGVVLFFGAELIVGLMYRSADFEKTVKVMRYSSLLPLFSVINGIIAINVMITFGLKKTLSKIIFVGCLMSLLMIVPCVLQWQEMGVVLCATLTEILIFCLLLIALFKRKVPLFYKK